MGRMFGHLILFFCLIYRHELNVDDGDAVLAAEEPGIWLLLLKGMMFGKGVSPPCDQLHQLLCWHVGLISLILSSAPRDTDGAVAKPAGAADVWIHFHLH